MRILVAEDEVDLNRLLCRALERAGYSVDACFNGEEVMTYLLGAEYDCLLLDVMMPRMDGYEVVRRVRDGGNGVPIILLTARDGVQDRVHGLDIGADDYLVKPFDMDELLARIRAATRKYGAQKTSILTLEDLTMDTRTHSVVRAGREVRLSAKEYAILQYMMQNQGIVLSKEQIENHAWSYDYQGGSNVVAVYMTYLRKKVDGEAERKLLHTIRGHGWVLR